MKFVNKRYVVRTVKLQIVLLSLNELRICHRVVLQFCYTLTENNVTHANVIQILTVNKS